MLIRAVGLAGFERYYPHELSGGMRKRAALIRTLAYDPPVILMDEPFAAVDAQTRTQLQADLLTLWGLGRKTIIFVTHDITEAIALGDRALVLSRQPTRIAAEHAIPIPRPRNVQDIFALEGFAAVHQRIRSDDPMTERGMDRSDGLRRADRGAQAGGVRRAVLLLALLLAAGMGAGRAHARLGVLRGCRSTSPCGS